MHLFLNIFWHWLDHWFIWKSIGRRFLADYVPTSFPNWALRANIYHLTLWKHHPLRGRIYCFFFFYGTIFFPQLHVVGYVWHPQSRQQGCQNIRSISSSSSVEVNVLTFWARHNPPNLPWWVQCSKIQVWFKWALNKKKLQAVVGYHWFFRGFSCLAQESFKYTRED